MKKWEQMTDKEQEAIIEIVEILSQMFDIISNNLSSLLADLIPILEHIRGLEHE